VPNDPSYRDKSFSIKSHGTGMRSKRRDPSYCGGGDDGRPDPDSRSHHGATGSVRGSRAKDPSTKPKGDPSAYFEGGSNVLEDPPVRLRRDPTVCGEGLCDPSVYFENKVSAYGSRREPASAYVDDFDGYGSIDRSGRSGTTFGTMRGGLWRQMRQRGGGGVGVKNVGGESKAAEVTTRRRWRWRKQQRGGGGVCGEREVVAKANAARTRHLHWRCWRRGEGGGGGDNEEATAWWRQRGRCGGEGVGGCVVGNEDAMTVAAVMMIRWQGRRM
jgi:hypothetical protein